MVTTTQTTVNVPATWDSAANDGKGAVGSKQEVTVESKQAGEFTDILELYENDEQKAVDAVNSLLLNQAKQRAYQNALARIKPPDNPEAARERAVTQLIRCGIQ